MYCTNNFTVLSLGTKQVGLPNSGYKPVYLGVYVDMIVRRKLSTGDYM